MRRRRAQSGRILPHNSVKNDNVSETRARGLGLYTPLFRARAHFSLKNNEEIHFGIDEFRLSESLLCYFIFFAVQLDFHPLWFPTLIHAACAPAPQMERWKKTKDAKRKTQQKSTHASTGLVNSGDGEKESSELLLPCAPKFRRSSAPLAVSTTAVSNLSASPAPGGLCLLFAWARLGDPPPARTRTYSHVCARAVRTHTGN